MRTATSWPRPPRMPTATTCSTGSRRASTGRLRPGHAAGRLCGDDQGRRGQHRHERLGCQPGHGRDHHTTLESGESDLSWDMGIVATPARIGDRVWLDANANGVHGTRARPASPASPSSSGCRRHGDRQHHHGCERQLLLRRRAGHLLDRGDGPGRLRGDGPEPGRQRSDRQRHRPGHRDERHGDGGGGRDQPRSRRGHLRDRQPGRPGVGGQQRQRRAGRGAKWARPG